MDTPIRLRIISTKDQRAFLGSVRDPNLQSICKEVGSFTNEAVWMVLGREFLWNENRCRVNMNITSRFLASLLDLGGDKVDMLMQLRKVFKEDFLGDDIIVVILVEVGVEIPWASELSKLLLPNQTMSVARQPFLLNLNAEHLTRHRKWARIGRDFLRKWLLLDEFPNYMWLE